MDITQDGSYRRHSTYHAFLPPKVTQERKARLKICCNTIVARVELEADKESGVLATGVHFEATQPWKAGTRYFAKARREIILCAGALGSPQILMLR